MSLIELVEFPIIGDERGSLIALEQQRNIPFEIKRIYYLFDTREQVRRGFHAHRKLEQMLVCVSGQCTILLDDADKRESITLDSPNLGLRIRPMTWRELYDFSSDCVLLVLADAWYNESDYIRDYSTFLKLARQQKGASSVQR